MQGPAYVGDSHSENQNKKVMIKSALQLTWIFALASVTLFTSCEKENLTNTTEIENYVEETVFGLNKSANCGSFGCYELVFPVTLIFADSSEVEVNSYEEIREAATNWKEANPDLRGRPIFKLPIDVIDEDGTVITAETPLQLRELARNCRKKWYEENGPNKHRGEDRCFRLVFPLEMVFPPNDTVTLEGPVQMRHTIREWRRDNRRNGRNWSSLTKWN